MGRHGSMGPGREKTMEQNPAPGPSAAAAEISRRDSRGRWVRGGPSPNPGGRPKEVGHVRELARQHTGEAIATLVEILRHGTPDRARVAAAQVLLERGWGRPEQPLVGPGGGALQVSWAELMVRALSAAESAGDAP